MNSNNIEEKYLLTLIRVVMNDKPPDDIPENFDIERFYEISCLHEVENLAYYGLEKVLGPLENLGGFEKDKKALERWDDIRDLLIVKDITQLTELDEISNALADAKIRHVLLKGSVLKHIYPQTDFRTMSDLDILIDPQNAAAVRKILEGLGYETTEYGRHVHDVYQKEPVMNVEIHRQLFDYTNPQFNKVYGDAFKHCKEESPYVFKFDLEYDLAYILAHLSKHYRNGGTGLRSFLDIWVYLKAYHDELDFSKLNSILDVMSFKNEAYAYMNLSLVLFGSKPSNEHYDAMIDYIFKAGAYGSVKTKVENDIRRNGKFMYFLKQLFPTVADMKNTYPVLKKCVLLLPLCYFHRLTVGSIKGWAYTKKKLKALF